MGFQRVSARRNYEFTVRDYRKHRCFQRVSARRNYELPEGSASSHPLCFQRVSARRNYEFLNTQEGKEVKFPACLCT